MHVKCQNCHKSVVTVGMLPVTNRCYCSIKCLREFLASEPENGNTAYAVDSYLSMPETSTPAVDIRGAYQAS